MLFKAFPWTPVPAGYLQDEQGRPKDQMELGGSFHSFVSQERETVGREILKV